MANDWQSYAWDLISGQEGFDAVPKIDTDGKPRVGFGSDYVTLEDGSIVPVKMGMAPITKADAGRDLTRQIPEYGQRVISAVGQDNWDRLPPKTQAALASVAYNYGSPPPSLVSAIKAGGDPFDVAVAIDKLGYNKGINNPSRRLTEAVSSLGSAPPNIVDTANMASNNDDAFSARFGAKTAPKSAATPAPADDAFSARFGKVGAPPAVDTGNVASIPRDVTALNASIPGAATGPQAGASITTTQPTPKTVGGLAGTALADANKNRGLDPAVGVGNAVKLFTDPAYASQALKGAPLLAGALRGGADVGDNVAHYGLKLGAGAARLLANQGMLDPKIADSLDATTADVDARSKAGEDWYNQNFPAAGVGPGGLIPGDTASWGRLGGQMIATAPVVGPVAKIAGGVVDAAVSNPLVRGMLKGATIGGTQAAAISDPSKPILPQIETGAMLGGVFGVGGPLALKAGKTVFEKLGLTGGEYGNDALNKFNGYLDKLGITPQDADTALKALGPDATYADLDEALRTKAAALASRGDETTSTLKSAYRARSEAGPSRTATAIDNILGPAPDVTQTEEDITAAAQKAAEPHYTAAKTTGAPLDATPVVQKLDTMIGEAKGDTQAALTKVKSYLYSKQDVPQLDKNGQPVLDANGQPVTTKQPVLDDSISALHKARIEIDDDIAAAKKNQDTSARRGQLGSLKQARTALDDLLKTNSDMAAGDQAFADGMKVKGAFDMGQNVFKNDTRVEDLQRYITTATPEQLAQLQNGARAAIDDATSNAAQGEVSATQSLFGKKSANRAKLQAVFPGKADQLLDVVTANAIKKGTENAVLASSRTAELRNAQQEFEPKTPTSWGNALLGFMAGAGHGDPTGGLLTGGAVRAAGNISNKLAKAGVNATAQDVARMLSATGQERDKIVNALLKRATGAQYGSLAKKAYNAALTAPSGRARELGTGQP